MVGSGAVSLPGDHLARNVRPEGVLVKVEGLDQALDLTGILEARVYRAPGWTFGPFRRGADRAGFVLARGESRDDALERAGRAMKRIRFSTAEVAPQFPLESRR